MPRTERLARRRAVLSLLVITPLGFLCKWYVGPAQNWVNNYAVGVPYELFWCLLLFLCAPRRERVAPVVTGVLLATGVLEALQLWHPPLLELVRSTFLGRALLGTTFSWWDYPHYVLGCVLAYVWMLAILPRAARTGSRAGREGEQTVHSLRSKER